MKYILGSMIVILISVFTLWVWVVPVYAQDAPKCDPDEDIMLNTFVPFVWRCIKKSTKGEGTDLVNVFPKLVGWTARIVMTAIIIIWFLWIMLWWFMIASDWAFWSKAAWVKLIVSIIAWLILLWASWTILNLINPEFFWLDS